MTPDQSLTDLIARLKAIAGQSISPELTHEGQAVAAIERLLKELNAATSALHEASREINDTYFGLGRKIIALRQASPHQGAGGMSDLAGKFEPEAKDCRSTEDAALTSIAISLKRIADLLDGTASGLCVTETLFGKSRNV